MVNSHSCLAGPVPRNPGLPCPSHSTSSRVPAIHPLHPLSTRSEVSTVQHVPKPSGCLGLPAPFLGVRDWIDSLTPVLLKFGGKSPPPLSQDPPSSLCRADPVPSPSKAQQRPGRSFAQSKSQTAKHLRIHDRVAGNKGPKE